MVITQVASASALSRKIENTHFELILKLILYISCLLCVFYR